MTNVSPLPQRVRLHDLTDLASAVPHMLGFHPTDSLVAIALCGDRDRLSFSMRLDLPDPGDDGFARMTAARMAQAGAHSVLLFVYTDAPGEGDDLPRRDLVDEVTDALEVPVRDAMLVADGRVWSYTCADAACCPPEGRPMSPDSPGALALAAAHALHGHVVLPDRDALVATAWPVRGIAAESMRQAILRALLHDDDAAADQVDLDVLCARFADPRASLTHDEAATLALRLHDIVFRDTVISRVAAGDDALDRLVTALARLAQPPYDAPAASVLAMVSYLRGVGVVAMAAAERALASDPDYSLAQLVVDCLDRQLDPARIRDVWRSNLG
jgi:hypothetical protein